MIEQFFDLSFEQLDGGAIRLTQHDGINEPAIIDAHPVQLLHIAASLSGKPEINQLGEERIATLERRLCWMHDRFLECYEAVPCDLFERCSGAAGFYSWLDASVTVAAEFCADFPDASSNALSIT